MSTPVHEDPWNLQGALASMPPQFILLLNGIIRRCREDCSCSSESADDVTRELHVLLQQLIAAVDDELRTDPGSDIRTSSDSWYLLDRLVEAINRHFQVRPRIAFTSADEGSQSVAAAARGIKQCVTRIVELLSADGSRTENSAGFAIILMDSEDDAEQLMRFPLLDMISRRVIAVKRPEQAWHATIDGACVSVDCSASGEITRIAPVLQFASGAAAAAASGDLEQFDEAICAICMCCAYESRSDGGVTIDVREMKCAGRHTFHTQCAIGWFVNEKHNVCPYCRHDFRICFIKSSLEHRVDYNSTLTGFTVRWNNPHHQRLAALNLMSLLPEEVQLESSFASALLLSCFESAAIAEAALRSGHLSSASDFQSEEQNLLFCTKLVEAFIGADGNDAVTESLVEGISDISASDRGRVGIVAAGGCSAFIGALKIAENDNRRCAIAAVLWELVQCREGREGVITAGGCDALVEAFDKAYLDSTRSNLAGAISEIIKIEEGCTGVVTAHLRICLPAISNLQKLLDEPAELEENCQRARVGQRCVDAALRLISFYKALESQGLKLESQVILCASIELKCSVLHQTSHSNCR